MDLGMLTRNSGQEDYDRLSKLDVSESSNARVPSLDSEELGHAVRSSGPHSASSSLRPEA
jgi:hypothetical protein